MTHDQHEDARTLDTLYRCRRIPMNTANCDIMEVLKYEWPGGALTPRTVAKEGQVPMQNHDTPNNNLIPVDRRPYWSDDHQCYLVPLTRRMKAKISPEDVGIVGQYRWHAARSRSSDVFYAARTKSPENSTVFMHRLISPAEKGMAVDHANHDTLDNRRCNLRIATTAQNNANVRPSQIGKSGFVGVYQVVSGRWVSQYRRDNKTVCLGTFDTPEEAASSYDAAISEARGEFAVTNESLGLLKEGQS